MRILDAGGNSLAHVQRNGATNMNHTRVTPSSSTPQQWASLRSTTVIVAVAASRPLLGTFRDTSTTAHAESATLKWVTRVSK
jgi:hypothetical protein